MTTETVFEVLAEGGGLRIGRRRTQNGDKFLFNHCEFDPTDEGHDVNKEGEYDSFEKAFQRIAGYRWYSLHLETIHEDFTDYLIENMMEKLNTELVSPDYLDYSKNDIERVFKIELKCEMNNKNEPNWSFKKSGK
jgi:hypothetical protein